jgi:hypothetical protein
MRFTVLTYLAITLSFVRLDAQIQPNFVISGTVQDETGAVFNAAQVDLLRNGTQERTTVTDVTGVFRFDRIQSGSYEVRTRVEHFKTNATKVNVGRQSPAPLKIILSIESVTQQVEVTADSTDVSTDSGENRDAVAVDTKTLDDLPIFDQDYVGTMSRFLDSSALGTNGVTLILDGMEMNSSLSASAIQEVKINDNPYSAEFPRPGRGRIEVITKPGSPEFHGTMNFFFRDATLNARDPFAVTKPPEQRRIFEGSLLGRLVNGKSTSFMITGNHQEQDNESIVAALTPSGTIRANVPNPQRNTEFSLSMNRQPSERTTYSLRFQYHNQSIRNQGVGGTNLPEVAANFHDREDQITYTQKTVFSNAIVNQFRMYVARQHTPTTSVQSAPQIVVLGAFTAGGAQGNRLQTENHTGIYDYLSWIHKKHNFEAGVTLPDQSRRGLDDNTNQVGTFYFSSLQDYSDQHPFSFVQQRGDGHIVFWEKNFGTFFQDQYQVRPNLNLTAGLRYDWQNNFHDDNNFAPRLSVAYAPGASRKTVIRAGGGFFFDRTGPRPIFDLLRYNGVQLLRFLISYPTYPDPYGNGTVEAQPSSVVRLDPNVRIPYTFQHSVAVERQLNPGTTLTVSYFRTTGIVFRSRDINAPLPPLYLARSNSAFSQIRQIESSARQVTESFEIAFRGNVTRYFSGMAQYTLGRAYNNSSGITSFPASSYDLSGEWSRADFDQRHRFNLLGSIKPGHLFNLGIALQATSGSPYSETTGRDDDNDGLALDRPLGVRRNSLEGPGYVGFDMRGSKDFLLTAQGDKGPKLTLAVDAFNLTNRVNYSGYIGNLSSPLFGRAVSSAPARRLQMSLRFAF